MKKYLIVVLALASAVLYTGCGNEYLTDGGVHDPHVDMTTYDFLASHPWDYFDTLVMLIDHNNMKEEVNAAGTFVVVTDYSFRKYMHVNWNLDSLKKHVTADTLRNYLFDQPIKFEDLSVSEKNLFSSASGKSYEFELIEQKEGQYTEWTNTPVYRLSVNRKIGGIEAKSYIQSTNIQTNTGIVHAMANQHIFNYGQ